jgi:hypothetical protein
VLFLTHTYILQNALDTAGIKNYDPDIFVYNIVPDLLTIHPDIDSKQTHKIKRFLQIPALHPKAAYVMFHLLVDDLAHYGLICPAIPDEFNPESQGYSYIKGKPLINSILDFHQTINKEISYNEAAYRSHLIVEMIYDLVILDQINQQQSIKLLAEAISNTAENKMDEFIATINWLYDLSEAQIRDVMNKAFRYLTIERMQQIMNIEGRIRLYADKFGLQRRDPLCFDGIKNLFLQAIDLLDDKEIFLKETGEAIKKYGWLPPITQPF